MNPQLMLGIQALGAAPDDPDPTMFMVGVSQMLQGWGQARAVADRARLDGDRADADRVRLAADLRLFLLQSAIRIGSGETERALLEQRHYQRRTFQGARHLRALLHPSGDKGAMLTYLPECLSNKLPMFQRFGVRLIAEVYLSVDQYEAYPYALEVLALAREIPEGLAVRRG